MPLLTIAEVLRAVQAQIDPGATLLAGDNGLDREVAWAVTARPSSPMFPSLRSGELAIAAAPVLRNLDPPASLREFITGLEERGACGLALRGPLDSREGGRAAARASELLFPLILLSDNTHLSDVERGIATLVSERRDELYRRTSQFQELQFQFVDRSIDGRSRSLEALARTLAGMIDAPVLITGADFEPRFRAGAAGPLANLQRAWGQLREQALVAWRAPGALDASRPTEPPVRDLSDGAGQTIITAPIIVRERILGAITIAPAAPATSLDRITLARAAGVGALELARDHAVAAAETRTQERMRGEFVTELLSHNGGDEALVSRARALGVELAPGYAVAIVGTNGEKRNVRATAAEPNRDTEREIEAVARLMTTRIREPRAMLHTTGDKLLLIWPFEGRQANPTQIAQDTPGKLTELAEQARQELEQRTGKAAAGIGRSHRGLSGAAQSREEAEQALWSAWHLFGGGRVCDYAEVGVYRLLLLLRTQHSNELNSFYYETLGGLAAQEGASKAELSANTRLLDTLESFLAHGGNVSETANALHLHRNTLNYRLHRIEEITGLELDDPSVRFRVQVALAVRRLL